jgi:hypothetical protein
MTLITDCYSTEAKLGLIPAIESKISAPIAVEILFAGILDKRKSS